MTGKDDKNKANGNERVSKSPNWVEYQSPSTAVKTNPERYIEGDAKILAEAYKTFAKGGITRDEAAKLEKIDEVLKDASIQLIKNGGAVVVDSSGKSTKLR